MNIFSQRKKSAKPAAGQLPFTLFVLGVLVLFGARGVHSKSFNHIYDFDNENPFTYWTSNGSYKIHKLETVPCDKSTRGRIGRIDIELINANYVYLSIDTDFPLSGNFKLSGDIRIEKAENASATLGANITISPIRRSGVYTLQPIKHSIGWVHQFADIGLASREKAAKIVDRSFYGVSVKDVGVWLDRIGIFVRGKPGGRIVMSLDNIQLDGNLPTRNAYIDSTEKAWSACKYRIRQHLNDLAEPILNTQNLTNQNAIPLQNKLQNLTNRLFADFSNNGFISPEAYSKLLLYSEMAGHIDQIQPTELAVYPWHPTSPILILPKTNPVPARLGNTLSIQACRGEYEPTSFILRSSKKLPYVTIKAAELSTKAGQIIPAKAIDIRLVKCWFQAGSGDLRQKRVKTLVPELLLKDNDLVRVDLETQTNALRGFQNGKFQYFDITHPKSKIPSNAVISDATELEPFDLAPDFNQQVWLTVKIPDDAQSGDYLGQIDIRSMGKSLAKLDLNIEVLPFDLPPPAMEYAIYYRGKLASAEKSAIGSEYKSEAQYKKEMADLKAHGIDSPTLYQPFDRLLDRALDIRDEAGLSNYKLFLLSLQTKGPFDPASLTKLEKKVRRWKTVSERRGYHHLYVYGIDEAKDDLIVEQLPAWRIVKANGGRIFVACPHHADNLSEKILDLGILNGPLDHATANRWSGSSLDVFSYSNPQVGIENPAIYRSNYGFNLWLAGYSGAMNYAYQHAFGDIWNDFDHRKYRDHVFAYPITNGLIGTIQYEGFREAVDDIRYLSKVLSANGQTDAEIHHEISAAISQGFAPSTIRKALIQKHLNS